MVERPALATRVPTGSVPDGMRPDFLTGKAVKDSPEQYVRQNIEKALVRQYKYPYSDCIPDFPVRVGNSRVRIDIAVFRSGERHIQDNLDMIIITRKVDTPPSDRTNGVKRLQEIFASCPGARYAMWTNGEERKCFANRAERNAPVEWEEIPDIPAFGKTEADWLVPKKQDLRPATGDNLLFAFRRCHNHIAANEGKQKPEAFLELLKIIFCKIEDERGNSPRFFVTKEELNNGTGATATKARLDHLFQAKVVAKYPTIFPGAETEIDLRPGVLAYVVSQLQNYSLLRSPVDVKGVAYEEVVGSNLRGDRGEFFTPRNACRMAVLMLNPQPGERIIDPASGTGGFLISAMNHALDYIRLEHEQNWDNPRPTEEESYQLESARFEYLSTCVFGLDLNPALVRAAKMNMVMNNDGSGGLWQSNSLDNPHRWPQTVREALPLGSLDIVVTNPPFGANIRVDDTEILSQYDLAAVWDQAANGTWTMRTSPTGPVLQRAQPPEILFIERCLQLLKPGGRMAIVLPNGILNNPALGYVRQWLLTSARVLAVVDMARELFQPKNDTQTSMLLLQKLTEKQRAEIEAGDLDYGIFMAVAEKVGKDRRGGIIWKRDETGNDVLEERTEGTIDFGPDGEERITSSTVLERVVDDDTETIAMTYRRWLQGSK